MTRLRTEVLRLVFLVLGMGSVAMVPILAASTVIGSAVGSINTSISGQNLLPNTTIFSGDRLQVGNNGVAVIGVGANDRMIFGQNTVASFVRDADGVTVLLSQGNLSMLHPHDGTPLRVKAGEISIVPLAGSRTLGDIAWVDGSVVITAKEGALQVEDHGATKHVAKGQTIVIPPSNAKAGAGTGATSAMAGGAALSGLGGTGAAAVGAVGAAAGAATAAHSVGSRPTGPGSTGAGTNPLDPVLSSGGKVPKVPTCPPSPKPLPPTAPVASTVMPIVHPDASSCVLPYVTGH